MSRTQQLIICALLGCIVGGASIIIFRDNWLFWGYALVTESLGLWVGLFTATKRAERIVKEESDRFIAFMEREQEETNNAS